MLEQHSGHLRIVRRGRGEQRREAAALADVRVGSGLEQRPHRVAIARDLQPQAELHLELPRGPGSQLSYRVRTGDGTVAFSDTSRGNPRSFFALAAFTKDVTERVCGIER